MQMLEISKIGQQICIYMEVSFMKNQNYQYISVENLRNFLKSQLEKNPGWYLREDGRNVRIIINNIHELEMAHEILEEEDEDGYENCMLSKEAYCDEDTMKAILSLEDDGWDYKYSDIIYSDTFIEGLSKYLPAQILEKISNELVDYFCNYGTEKDDYNGVIKFLFDYCIKNDMITFTNCALARIVTCWCIQCENYSDDIEYIFMRWMYTRPSIETIEKMFDELLILSKKEEGYTEYGNIPESVFDFLVCIPPHLAKICCEDSEEFEEKYQEMLKIKFDFDC